MNNIAVFASGTGSNAEVLINYFRKSSVGNITLVVTNKEHAGVVERAKRSQVPVIYTSNQKMSAGTTLQELHNNNIDFIVLAGFLLKIPSELISAYPKHIINIHPSLLPKFGGKGMFGHHVHEAVLANKETKTGITIHLVNEHYDEGRVLEQFSCPVFPSDTVDDLQQRIHTLEHTHYPAVIEKYLCDESEFA